MSSTPLLHSSAKGARLVNNLRAAAADIGAAFEKYQIALVFGFQDIAQRYRRSRIGVFWLTINMSVMVFALGMIFGTILHADMRTFLPFLSISMIIWGFIASIIGEGCTTFSDASGLILQTRIPFFTHVMRVITRNAVVLLHNIIIFPVVVGIYGIFPSLSWFLAIPGFLILLVNLSWIALFLATLCARYRDMAQVMQNVVQVLFYVTPVIWQTSSLPQGHGSLLLALNPFYHLLEIVRAPLLNRLPTALDWEMSIGLAILGWLVAGLFFGRFRSRIAYWL